MAFKKGCAPGPGRKKGEPNKNKGEIKAALALEADKLVKELIRLATKGRNEATRVAAIKECLDRYIGKPAQHVEAKIQIAYEVTLAFGESDDAVPATIPGPARNGSAVDYSGSA